jgi:hypothetical protein
MKLNEHDKREIINLLIWKEEYKKWKKENGQTKRENSSKG